MSRKPETIDFWCGRLPHWEVTDGLYFVTIHLSGAIPQAGQRRIRQIAAELDAAPPETDRLKVNRKIFRELEVWLDRAPKAAHLADERVARMLMEAIEHRASKREWNVFEYVVMPNHVHLFFELLSVSLKNALEGFKEWTGRQATRFISLTTDRFWQREWFDHWSRSDEEDERIINYIRQNPVKAGLVKDFRLWPYGSWSPKRGPSLYADPGPAGPSGPTGHEL